ncbi:MAG: trypsin-like peptidase domain-containing protein [Labilithrix sp.]|nr:trypsin-like peptidase domain-containing protein [Labilithrix sp.]MCW5817577.1 trypsin-like peptidase domain-containing protein [Labilithrix sp.]
MTMRTVLLGCLLLLTMIGCAPVALDDEERGSTSSNQFFVNASRRDPTALEASRVGRVNPGCAAFFLENDVNKTFLMTARHCFDFDTEAWCATDGEIVQENGTRGQCTRVVVEDDSHDLVVFEADMKHAAKGSTTLRLASYAPRARTRLTMIGYPADADPDSARLGAITTTENCWTLGSRIPSLYSDPRLNDMTLRHNCSTYGGNSGGPMYVEGTRDVVGLPYTYIPDDYTRREANDETTAARLALTWDFVNVYFDVLTAEGITIVETGAAAAEDQAAG